MQFSSLASPTVWLEAATQVFFSLSVGFGTLIAMSSYNPVHNNCKRDAIFISLTDSFTSVFAAVVVFSVFGFKVWRNRIVQIYNNSQSMMTLIIIFIFKYWIINGGYYMATRRYEISLWVLKNILLVSAANEWMIFSTLKEKFRIQKGPCNVLFII